MIEQYLKDSIPEPDRKAKIETLANLDLMPERIKEAIRIRDSLSKVKNSNHSIEKGLIKSAKDTSEIEDDEDDADSSFNSKKEVPKNDSFTDTVPSKKTNTDLKQTHEAILTERRRKPDTSHTVK
jgi:penicillin-binding protein 2